MFNINFALDWIQTADLWTLESEATTLPMSQNDCPIVNFFFHLKLEWGNFWKFRVFACGTLGRTLASGTRLPKFESSHGQFLKKVIILLLTVEKSKIKKFRGRCPF